MLSTGGFVHELTYRQVDKNNLTSSPVCIPVWMAGAFITNYSSIKLLPNQQNRTDACILMLNANVKN